MTIKPTSSVHDLDVAMFTFSAHAPLPAGNDSNYHVLA